MPMIIQRIYPRVFKRLIDIQVAFLALLALFPILAILALLVRVKHGYPVFFSQERPGLHGKSFTIYKFRTMTNEKGPDGILLPPARRLTSFGQLMRSTSLDELPELWNVLKGDMSLIGPRPLIVEYLPLYTPEQARRHFVRPGITGLAQVRGRNILSWEEKFAFDIWYVDHLTFDLDVKIFLLTIRQVLKREGIGAKDGQMISRFIGTKDTEKAKQGDRAGMGVQT